MDTSSRTMDRKVVILNFIFGNVYPAKRAYHPLNLHFQICQNCNIHRCINVINWIVKIYDWVKYNRLPKWFTPHIEQAHQWPIRQGLFWTYTTGKKYGIFFILAIFYIFVECAGFFCTWNTFLRANITFGGVNLHLTAKWSALVQKQLFRYFSQFDFG